MCILQQVDLRWNWSQRVKHCCTKSLGAMGLFWLLADCHSCLQFARKISIYLQIYASPSLSSSKTAWHYTTRSRVCTPSLCLGNTFFFPLLCDRWLQWVIKSSLGLCSRLFIKIIAPMLKNGSPRKGESKSNNRRDKKESKVVKIILVLF